MSLLDQWETEDKGEHAEGSGVRFAMEATSGLDAQKAARVSQLAKSLGLPEGFVAENPHKAEQEHRTRALEKNSLLSRWASEDKLNAAMARDDAEPMGGVFDSVGKFWDRETDAIGKAWDKGEGQRQLARLGNRYLSGDTSVLPEVEKLRKEIDPYGEQDAFGILKPGILPSISQPLRQQQAKEYPPDKPLQAELDAEFAWTRIVDDSAGPLQQELDDLFSSPPHIHEIEGKGILLPSIDAEGKPLTKDQAIARFMEDGQHAGVFANPQSAMAFLSQSPDRQRELYANWKEKPEESWIGSTFGPAGGIEQLPRMLFDQLPLQANRASWGAAGGFATGAGTALALGQAGPQVAVPEEVVTVPAAAIGGFFLGGKTGWITGAAESAFWSERGSFALELARERDANGKPLSEDTIVIASNTYALLAAAEEALGEAFFLKMLKPLGIDGAIEKLGSQGVRGFLRSAVKRAAFDRAYGRVLLDAGARMGANALGEGLEEAVQEATGILVEYLAKGYENQFNDKNFVGNNLFTAENASQIGQAFKGGSVAGFWLGSGPIMVSSAFDIQNAREANAYAQQHVDLHAKVEATSTKQLSPAHMQSALEAAGPAMQEQIQLPADAALELYQSGTDLLSPLGITEQEAVKAAEQGQSFIVSVSRMHAYFDQQQFEAAAQIMRRSPEAVNVTEAARLDEELSANAQRVIELYQQQAAELDQLTQEKENLRKMATKAVRSSISAWAKRQPGGIEGFVNNWAFSEQGMVAPSAKDFGGIVKKYVDDWLNTVERNSLRMAATGANPVDMFRKFSVQSLRNSQRNSQGTTVQPKKAKLVFEDTGGVADVDAAFGLTEEDIAAFERGEVMSEEEYARQEEAFRQQLQQDMRSSSIVSQVRGRIDGKSLKQDWPDAYKKLVRMYGPGFFKSAERGGIPLDYISAELANEHILPHDASADDLLNILYEGYPELFQNEIAEESLRRDVAAWSNTVDAFLAGQLSKNEPVTMLQQTPLVLQMIGAQNRPMQTTFNVLVKAFAKHGLSAATIKQVPGAMADPIMIFRSASTGGDYVMMLDIKDEHGATVVVPLTLEYTAYKQKTVNQAHSIYVKNFEESKEPNNQWFARQVEQGNLVYKHEKKSRNWFRNARLQLPRNAEGHGINKNRIYTDANLVKMKGENPELYQSALPVESDAFKNWFGDSKVVDENGKPLVVYHGTRYEFEEFEPMHPRGAIGNPKGIYFTNMPHVASEYAMDVDGATDERSKVIPVYLKIENESDGIIRDVSYGVEGEKEYIIFKPENVKAVNNRGTFDPADPRILYQNTNELAEIEQLAEAQGVDLYLNERNGIITISKIIVPEGSRNSGIGTEILQRLIDYAESTGKMLALTPSEEFGGQKKKLISWYKSLGFVENKGKTRVFSTTESLIRNPSNTNRVFYQGRDTARGSLRRQGDGWLISLFQQADPSTLLHETAHIFFEEMETAVNSGVADAGMIADYNSLNGWFARFDNDVNLKAEYDTSVKGHPLFEGRDFETLSAEEKATVRTIAEKEYFARGFEAFLLEGKAPSEALEGVFSRFRKWLLAVYRDIKSLNVELNDDVRGVFERMISMEKEVAYAAARNELLDLTQSELDALGITGPAREYAGKLMAAARDAAAQNLEQDRNRDRKRRLGQYAKEAREELMKLPLYVARSDIRKSPLDATLVRELYGEETAKALRKSLPFGLKEEGGVDPEIFAAEHGFASGTEMVAQILEAPSMKKAVEQRVQEKEAEHDAMFPPADYLIETAQANEQVAMVGKYLAQNLGRQHVQQEAFARVAEQELAAMPLSKAMQTGNFIAAMRRALRQERLAIGRGDFAAALEANHKARLNMEFARRSRDITKTQGVMQRLVKRFIGMSKADPDARYIVMDVGMRHGLNTYNERLGEGRDVRTIQTWFTDADADGYTVYADDAILYGPGKSWREMTLTEFETLSEVINQIVTVERNKRKLLTAQGKADLDTVADSIAGSIYEHRSPKAAKTVEGQPAALKALKGIHAIHMKVESICIALDGDTRGPTWEAIYLPIAKADDAQSMRFKEVRNSLVGSNLFGTYTRQELASMGSKKEIVQEIGESLTWENRIAVALNMGNEANISRIKDGHNWNDEQIAAVLRPLTKRDWAFVQNVWDYIGSFKEEAFALQEEISGMRPVSVEGQPFTVQPSDGANMQLRGGYYPIKYNGEKGFQAFMQEQKAMDKELFGGRNYGAAMTKNGHLKERANGGMGSPLLLELSVITDHIFNVVHDITYRKAVLDVAKVIKHKAVREAIESTVGQQIYRELMPWLQDVANERQEPMHAVHRWARWARASTSIMTMGYKFTTMFAQPLGFTQSIEVLGYKWAAAGLKRVYKNPLQMPQLLKETFAHSSFMANRIKSFDREVRDITKQLKPGMSRFSWVDKVKDNAFVPMGIFQMGVDLPTWWGAFEKGMREMKGDEKQAAQYADSVVRMSQGSGSTKDLARVQRGGEMLRLTTMFYSYFNTLYNLGARGITALKNDHSPAGIFKAANTALLLWFVPAVLSELFAGRGPDDDEGPLEWAAMNLLQYPFQAVVGVRDVGNAIFGEYGYQITPAQSAPKAIVQWFKAVSKALEEEEAGMMVKPTAEAVGYLFGLPMKQPIITVGNLWDYITGEDPELYARDLFFVKPKDRR